MTHLDWQDEALYIAELVIRGGDKNVSAEHVASYLEMQRGQARREGFGAIANDIDVAIDQWAVRRNTEGV